MNDALLLKFLKQLPDQLALKIIHDEQLTPEDRAVIADLKYSYGALHSDVNEWAEGSQVLVDNKTWLVVDNGKRNPDEVVLMLASVWCKSDYFGIRDLCRYFWEYEISDTMKQLCIPHHIVEHGRNARTIPVFVPTYTEVNGGFSYLNSNSRRIANYNGSPTAWWTSTPDTSDFVYVVYADGRVVSSYGYPSSTYGFRPFISIKKCQEVKRSET